MKVNICILLMVLFASTSFAKFWMPAIFNWGMVMQRDVPVKIWGVANPNEKIDVWFNWKKTSTVSDSRGEWSVTLAPMKANFKPMAMTIFVNDIPKKEIKDILVGDVWILGGQSNMEWRMPKTDEYKRALADVNKYEIRTFYQPKMGDKILRRDNPPGSRWCTTIGNDKLDLFSAVGYYFAEVLAQKENVPVGLIYTPVGGAKMITYIPESVMSKNEDYAKELAKFKKAQQEYPHKKTLEKWNQLNEEYNNKVAKAKAKKQKPPRKPTFLHFSVVDGMPYPYNLMNAPAFLYNKMVAPLLMYTAKGVLWYQGCGDAADDADTHFKPKFELLIDHWRSVAGNETLPFYCVQLASFGTKAHFASVRWAQQQTAKNGVNVGAVNIIDTGDEKDIHPWDKHIVGQRLANLVLQDVYKHDDVFGKCPDLEKIVYSGKSAEVSFKDFGRGITLKGDIRGFDVYSNGMWQKANATFKDGKIVVTSADGGDVAGVRYLWKNWARPDVCIYNNDGLPANPFINLR